GFGPAVPMLYDIQALQYLYGANMTYHSGNDTYSFTSSSAPLCIWDAGGTNTIDFHSITSKYSIDLNAGNFSSTSQTTVAGGGSTGNNLVSIAYGVTIQNAIGGSGGGTITCNDANDSIIGGAGSDTFVIGRGVDTIKGGGGVDTLQMTASA